MHGRIITTISTLKQAQRCKTVTEHKGANKSGRATDAMQWTYKRDVMEDCKTLRPTPSLLPDSRVL